MSRGGRAKYGLLGGGCLTRTGIPRGTPVPPGGMHGGRRSSSEGARPGGKPGVRIKRGGGVGRTGGGADDTSGSLGLPLAPLLVKSAVVFRSMGFGLVGPIR